MIYLAYGSNLNKEQMSQRCPAAKPVGKIYLPDYKLVFRGVADIEKSKDDYVPIGVWRVTGDCIRALDRYEGVPSLYQRVDMGFGFTYMMNSDHYSPPSMGYLKCIYDGYEDFGFSEHDIDKLMFTPKENTLVPRIL
jgi:hypothetical protein|tara:strand:- start:201 stop:611 length:411 start_codon:yes stop_codon:yes gene_type:complete